MKGKKAVSPIVATLLLILIAVAAAVVLYAWVSNLSSSTKGTGAENSGVAFTVESAKLYENETYSSPNWATTVHLWIRNIGSVPIENGTWTVQVLDQTTGTLIVLKEFTLNRTLSPGEIWDDESTILLANINSTVSGINAGDYYTVKVVSPQGVSDSITVKAQ